MLALQLPWPLLGREIHRGMLFARTCILEYCWQASRKDQGRQARRCSSATASRASQRNLDLAELLPSTNPLETTAFHGPPSGCFALLPGLEVVRQRRKQILTIADWTRAFAAYTATLVSRHPAATLEMLAYMTTIIRASQQCDGLHWRAYDYHYRLTAAASGNKNWTDLFTRLFTGRAHSVSSCSLCGSLTHGTSDCPEGSLGGRSAFPRKREFGKAGGVGAPAAAPKARRFSQNWALDVCAQFNAKGTCSFAGWCKFRHACAECGGTHPAKECSGTK